MELSRLRELMLDAGVSNPLGQTIFTGTNHEWQTFEAKEIHDMLNARLQDVTPTEVVALARLADSSDISPPPHLRSNLQAKGWVNQTQTGHYLLTEEGRNLLKRFD